MQYADIFFDLDHTLWDFETNSRQVLSELSVKYKLIEKGVPSFEIFMEEYFIINERLWDDYRKGDISKEALRFDRFHLALKKYEIEDSDLTSSISNDYTSISPFKTNLFPHAIEVLDYLSEKYNLHIITNGFEEVQHVKLKSSKIEKYFSEVITSESSGFKKPDIRMFNFSVEKAKAQKSNSLMIGDSLEADIIGARNAGIRQVYFNPKVLPHSEEITYEIKSLDELKELL